MGRKLTVKLIPKIPMMHFLSLTPFRGRVKFPTETYFKGVPSVLIIIEWGILFLDHCHNFMMEQVLQFRPCPVRHY